MSNYTIYTLAESQLTISNGAVLDGVTQGDGSHLMDETITLNSNAWETVDIADDGTDANFSDNDGDQTLNGDQTLFGTSFADGTVVEAEYTLTVQDPDGNTYTLIGFNINNSSPNYATIEGLAFIGTFPPINVPLTVVGTAEGPPNTGADGTPAAGYATPPCFANGTLVDTDSGPKRIEMLRPGDLIRTLDDGWQPLRMVLATSLSAAVLSNCPAHRPIRLCRDAIRPGVPARDIVVSPQHRVLVDDWRAQLFFGAEEVLVSVKHLVNGKDIRIEPEQNGVVYYHLVFDSHQIISAHGMFSESFHPGEETVAGFTTQMKDDFFCQFPHLAESFDPYGAAARPSLKRFEAAMVAL